ncbi:MAG: helix-turn-helix domain-containing protein [Rikenellaceae bacterium]
MSSDKTIEKLITEVDSLIEIVKTISKEYKPYFGGEHFITDSELCEALSVNRSTTHEWRSNGILSYYKVGGKIIYKQSDVEEMLNRGYYSAFDSK